MRTRRMKFLTPAAFLFALMVFLVPRPVAAQVTWTVDASGGGDFTEIQPAIDASQDGDLILVLDQAQVVERGTHDELVAARGLYHGLVSQQLAL